MTSEKKAYELCNKFYQGSVFDYDNQGHLEEKKRAKERALICVDEMLKMDLRLFDIVELQEVKREINKL